MALEGSEEALKESLVESITEALTENGATSIPSASIEGLAKGIANAIIPHLLSFAQVAPGIPVGTTGGAGATTDPGVII